MHVFELDPTTDKYFPGAHSVQVDTSVAPAASLQVPAVQLMQTVLLAVGVYCPAAQSVHVAEP